MSQEIVVYKSQFEVKGPKGKKYKYWRLQWIDANGKNQSKNIGPVKKLSERQAEKVRRAKEQEFARNPKRRNASRAPILKHF